MNGMLKTVYDGIYKEIYRQTTGFSKKFRGAKAYFIRQWFQAGNYPGLSESCPWDTLLKHRRFDKGHIIETQRL